MKTSPEAEVSVLRLSLHGRLVGYLTGFRNGRNVLSFAPEFREDNARPTFSLTTHPEFPRADRLMAEPWVRNQRLPPVLSNLLPEGSLRELITQGLKVHIDDEFHLLAYLGDDLPGGIIARPMAPEDVPPFVLETHGSARAVKLDKIDHENMFSLAGVQMKFSMKENDGRYNLSKEGAMGDWIIKTPSTHHQHVPLNEFTAMSLASLVGVAIPPIKLVNMSQLEGLPQIKLPDESEAFAIKRFDRDGDKRVHMEDFAQVLVKYPNEKYGPANYKQLGRVLYQYSGAGIADAQQFARRLLVNILLANGDAHLKNWSLLYADQVTPRLSPAYDIVTTSVYIEGEAEYALNLGKNKNWYQATHDTFETWAKHADIPWRVIKPHLDDVMDKARTLWPKALEALPMNEAHKTALKVHWGRLDEVFRIHIT